MISSRFIGALVLFLVLAGYAPAQSPDIHSRLNAGIELYRQGRWREAVLEFRRVQAEAPSRELRGEALFWISISQLFAGEYEQALREMDNLQATAPGHRRLGQLVYHRGRVLYHLERYDEAIVLLMRYADAIVPGPGGLLSPVDSSRKAAALFWTVECLFSMGRLDQAAQIFTHITVDFPASPKYEASVYRLALIDQKNVELELLGLLRWSHEESLRNMEEFRRRESSYDQALSASQRRITEMLRDTRLADLESENYQYRLQLEQAEARIRYLENALMERTSSRQETRQNSPLSGQNSPSSERLENLRTSARELETQMQNLNGNPGRDSR